MIVLYGHKSKNVQGHSVFAGLDILLYLDNLYKFSHFKKWVKKIGKCKLLNLLSQSPVYLCWLSDF